MKLKVLLHPDEIAVLPDRLNETSICVVFDILRATTSMVTAFQHGARSIRPVATVEEARAYAAEHPEVILAGERHGDPPPGFAWGNSPGEFCAATDRHLVMTTTNGTLGIVQSARAGQVWIAAFRNLTAIADQIRQANDQPIYLVAAGTGSEMSLEDVMAAGALCELLGITDLNDSTRIAALAWQQGRDPLAEGLRKTDNGRSLTRKNRQADIDWAAEVDLATVTPRYQNGLIT